jgi:hypothetical protein
VPTTSPAEIEIGVLPQGEEVIDDAAPYDTYLVDCTYVWDSGTVQLPGTGVGETPAVAAFVTVHGGQMVMECAWACQRTGQPPVLPAFQSADPNLIPLRGSIVVKQLDVSADANLPVFTVAGSYTYGVVDPALASVTAPVPPFLTGDLAATAALAASAYTDDVLWSFVGATGPNPFVLPTPVDAVPNNQYQQAADQSMSANVNAWDGANTTLTVPSGLTSSSTGGAGSQGGGITVGGGQIIYP